MILELPQGAIEVNDVIEKLEIIDNDKYAIAVWYKIDNKQFIQAGIKYQNVWVAEMNGFVHPDYPEFAFNEAKKFIGWHICL